MQIMIIAIFILMASVPPVWLLSPCWIVVSAWVYPLWVMGFSRLHTRVALGRSGKGVRLLGMWAKAQLVLGFGVLCAVGWMMLIRGLPLGRGNHVDQSRLLTLLLAIGPVILAMIGYWALQYDRVLQIRKDFNHARNAVGLGPLVLWSRRGFLAWQLRSGLLFVLLPLLAIQLGGDLVTLATHPWAKHRWQWEILTGATAVMIFGVFLIAPRILVWVAGAKKMGKTPIRIQLETLAKELGIRYRTIRIWPSGQAVANAAVMGIVGRLRYILISDSLLQQFTPPQIRAVFGHELGHVRRHHIPYLMLCLISLMLWASLVTDGVWWVCVQIAAGDSLPIRVRSILAIKEALSILIMVGFLVVVLGRLSRLFERQADMDGAYCASHPDGVDLEDDSISSEGISVFSEALEHLAWANAVPLDRHEFRHGSLGSRIDYLVKQSHHPHSLSQLTRRVRWVKRWILLSLVVGATVGWLVWMR
ncbi:MAG: M48 family metalloprotease [Phycisphaerales bacterium]|nr:M48 family metalloprotease [Phycisphaerales bacterium]